MTKSGWVATREDHYSLYRNGNVVADIEYYAAAYWRIVYYRPYRGRLRLQFAFEDASLSQVDIRMKVEAKVKQERTCSTPIPNDNTEIRDLLDDTYEPIKAHSSLRP